EIPERERARRSLEAGADLALLGHLPGQESIVAELAASEFKASQRRIERYRQRLTYDLPPFEPAPPSGAGTVQRPAAWASHRQAAADLARAAITVAHGAEQLPLKLAPSEKLCLVNVVSGALTPAETVGNETSPLNAQLSARHANTTIIDLPFGASEE